MRSCGIAKPQNTANRSVHASMHPKTHLDESRCGSSACDTGIVVDVAPVLCSSTPKSVPGVSVHQHEVARCVEVQLPDEPEPVAAVGLQGSAGWI